MLARSLKLTKKSKDSVVHDLEIAYWTQAFVERKEADKMHYNMSGGWAHRVDQPDHPKLVASMSESIPSTTDYPPTAVFHLAHQNPVYQDQPSSLSPYVKKGEKF